MKLDANLTERLCIATAKALGTYSNESLNVVPVSSVKVVDGKIWLIDYFFEKTKVNFLANPNVVLTFWTDLDGYQIKANSSYLTEGKAFDEATHWISLIHPNRTVKGLLVLSVDEVCDISISGKKL